jgi:hypothetical protein
MFLMQKCFISTDKIINATVWIFTYPNVEKLTIIKLQHTWMRRGRIHADRHLQFKLSDNVVFLYTENTPNIIPFQDTVSLIH